MAEPSQPITVDIEPARASRSLAADWRDLEERADGSFFQSWLWIGTWLAELPGEVEPLCLYARRGAEVVGLALLTPRRARRRGVIQSRQLHLNATGLAALDRLSIEYNGFLLDRRYADSTQRAILGDLAGRPALWDELVLDGVDPSLMTQAGEIGGQVVLRQRSLCPHVDLGDIADPDCLDYMGPNTRHQIRRAHRLLGNPEIAAAATSAEGLAFLDGLVEQHQARWAPRGQAGAFANDFVRAFHRRLVTEGVPAGKVQLLRVASAGLGTIGNLYNFLHRGRVYAYQSGFAQFADNRMKPGLVSHHLAIVRNRAQGMRVYDFLAGDSRYKRSLSNRQGELLWIVVQRPALRFAIEQKLRVLKDRLRRPASRPAGT